MIEIIQYSISVGSGFFGGYVFASMIMRQKLMAKQTDIMKKQGELLDLKREMLERQMGMKR